MSLVAILLLLAVPSLGQASSTVVPKIASRSCPTLLESNDAVISALKDLYERKILSAQNLAAVANGVNPLNQKQSVNGRTFYDVVTATIELLKQNLAGRQKLDMFIREITEDVQEQRFQFDATTQTAVSMTMYYIPGGTFLMGASEGDRNISNDPPRKVNVASFYAADIPVTQWQYAIVKSRNSSKFKTGGPNNPVVSVSWDLVQEYIKRLNRWSKQDNPLIYQIISNHIRHSRIRLLTSSEWEFLVRNRGQWRASRPDGISESNLHEYAWYWKYAHTKPVAELRPLVIAGHPFYDLLGNVWEWVQDGTEFSEMQRVLRGGSFGTGFEVVRSSYWISAHRDVGQEYIGFRLAEDPR